MNSFFENKRFLVMGLLDTQSIAWAIGEKIRGYGGEVTYTVQNERFRDVLLRRSFKKQGLSIDDFNIIPCDVTNDADLQTLSAKLGNIDGLVHSVAFANPKTCLTNDMFAAGAEDLKQAFHISAASLALVSGALQEQLNPGSGVVALSFNTLTSFPGYDWMGVCKASLEATARYMARDLGKREIRVNCISAGPLNTKAASSIPGFTDIKDAWPAQAPLGWNADEDHASVADTALFLLSSLSKRVTGETIYVDGGYHATRAVTGL